MEKVELTLKGQDDFFTIEAYKALRTNIQFCGKDIRVIGVTSCSENEGKTTIALNIAKSFSELGKRVLVIDASIAATHCDGMILVIGNPKLHVRQVQETVEQLKKSGCPILGAVRNHAGGDGHGYGYYRKKY